MDWSQLPSLTSLRAFAALADGKSYTRAATALNVSHAAVSQQVKALEERLGVSLVTRAGRGIALTMEGELLARDLEIGFAAIRRGVDGRCRRLASGSDYHVARLRHGMADAANRGISGPAPGNYLDAEPDGGGG